MTTIDSEGNVISTGELQKKFADAETAMSVYKTALSLEIQAKIEVDQQSGKFVVTLTDATPMQIGMLQRKCNITQWSKAATKMANSVTNAVTQVGDYALNGAIVPAVVAGGNMVLTTAGVVGTAASRILTGTAASFMKNTRIAAKAIAQSRELDECCSEFHQTIADAGRGFASLFGIDSEASLEGWEDPAQVQATQAQNQTQTAQTA